MSGPPGQYVHLPCGQAHGFGITATVVTPLMPRICLDISNGLRFGELCRTIRCRRSELDGTVGDRVSLHTSSLMRFTSSRVGESSLLRRSIIMSARGVSTRLNPCHLARWSGSGYFWVEARPSSLSVNTSLP